MARVRIARSRMYRRRKPGMVSGRRRGMYRMGSQYRSALKRVYSYKQIVLNPTGIGPVNVAAAGGDYLAAYNFNLSQAGGNVGPFTALYDQYRITKVVWQLVPKWNSSDIFSATSVSGGNLPMIATCIDYDDDNAPANLGDVIQRQNAKLHRGSKIITRTFKPCANFVVDAAGGGLTSKQSPWLDAQNITVPHYGIKLAITSVACPQDYEVICKYYLQFRQVR